MGQVKKYLYNLSFDILNLAFPLITLPYVARTIGVAGIGIVNFSINYANYFVLFAALGIPIYGIREVAKYKNEPLKLGKIISELITFNFTTSILFSIIYLITLFLVPKLREDLAFFMIGGLLIITNFTSIDWYYRGIENFKFITIRSFIIKLFSLCALFIFVKQPEDALIYLAITVFSSLGNNIWSFFNLMRKNNLFLKDLDLRKHIQPTIYIFSSTLAISLYAMFDTFLLGIFSSYEQVGYYTSATKIVKIIIPIVTAFGGSILPSISFSYYNNEKEKTIAFLKTILNYIYTIAIPISIGIFFIANILISCLLGKEFTPSGPLIKILSFLPLIIGLSNLFGILILTTLGGEKYLFRSVIIGSVISLSLNIALIPIWNSTGAAITNIVTECTIVILTFYYSKKIIRFNIFTPQLFYALGSCIFIILAYFIVDNILVGKNDILFLILFTITGFIFYFCSQLFLFKNTEIKNLITSFKKQ